MSSMSSNATSYTRRTMLAYKIDDIQLQGEKQRALVYLLRDEQVLGLFFFGMSIYEIKLTNDEWQKFFRATPEQFDSKMRTIFDKKMVAVKSVSGETVTLKYLIASIVLNLITDPEEVTARQKSIVNALFEDIRVLQETISKLNGGPPQPKPRLVQPPGTDKQSGHNPNMRARPDVDEMNRLA